MATRRVLAAVPRFLLAPRPGSCSVALVLLAGVLLLAWPWSASADCESTCGDTAVYDCKTKPPIAVGNGGTWLAEPKKNKGQDLHSLCPFGITGPYVTCLGPNDDWSVLKGGTECPGDANECPSNPDSNTESVPDRACRCKAGYSGTGVGPQLVCTACGANEYNMPGGPSCQACPTNMVPTSDKSACQCKGGWVPQQYTSWQQGNLACESCPAGYAAAAGDPRCSPCRGYYEFSTAGAQACSICPKDSYSTTDHTGCRCNTGCTSSGSGVGAGLICSCPVSTQDLQDCGNLQPYWEATGNVCQCKAGYLQSGVPYYTYSYMDPSCEPNTFSGGCSGSKAYSLAGDTTCRTCPANAIVLATKDGCMCKDGYAPAVNTSSQGGNLSCEVCPSGTFARAGDLACTKCASYLFSTAGAAVCSWCPGYSRSYLQEGVRIYSITIIVNAAQSACECVIEYLNSAYSMACTTGGTGQLSYCDCTPPTPINGRRLHSIGQRNTSFPEAPGYLDMATLASTSTPALPRIEVGLAAASRQDQIAEVQQQPATLTPIHIIPTLNMAGKPATVLPMEVVRTTWEGRDATDVAACLSGALLTTRNISLLAPPATLAELGLQQHAASLASGLLPQLWPEHGSAAVFTSSMYKGGPRLSARELKAALIKHYAGLLQLPSCLRVPSSAARRVRVALSNVVGMTTSTAQLRGGELADVVDSFTSVAELAVEVDHVVNEKHPELCAGIEGSSFRLRFAGFAGASSLSSASPNHIWVYAAVAEDAGLCGTAAAV